MERYCGKVCTIGANFKKIIIKTLQIYQAVHKLSWWFDVEFGKIMDNWKLNNRTVAVPKRMRASNGGAARYNVATFGTDYVRL